MPAAQPECSAPEASLDAIPTSAPSSRRHRRLRTRSATVVNASAVRRSRQRGKFGGKLVPDRFHASAGRNSNVRRSDPTIASCVIVETDPAVRRCECNRVSGGALVPHALAAARRSFVGRQVRRESGNDEPRKRFVARTAPALIATGSSKSRRAKYIVAGTATAAATRLNDRMAASLRPRNIQWKMISGCS